MEGYKTGAGKLPGTDFREVRRKAFGLYLTLKKKTKRRPYVRSAYFNKEKIFLDLFWHHLFEKKNWRDMMRRLKFYACALELIQKSRVQPSSKENPGNNSEILHRFAGLTNNDEPFCVQIKENKNSGQKFLISIFPIENE